MIKARRGYWSRLRFEIMGFENGMIGQAKGSWIPCNRSKMCSSLRRVGNLKLTFNCLRKSLEFEANHR